MALELPTLAYDRFGSGDPLVLVHPLGGDRGVWEPVAAELAAHHDVIAVDMPGFGASPELPPGLPATAANLAAAIRATLDGLDVRNAHVVGNSLGGWVALELAKTGRCPSVTGLCPAGFWPKALGPRPEHARNGARVLVPLLRPLLASAYARRLALSGSIAHPERVPATAAYHLVRSYALSPGFARANAEMRKTLFSGFDEIDAAITLAWGERDRLVGMPMKPLPATVRTVVLKDCGHVPTWDDPRQVIDVILDNVADGARNERAVSA